MRRQLAVGSCFFLIAACNRSTSDPQIALALQPSAARQIEALLAEKDARSPVERKISSQLLYAKIAAKGGLKDSGFKSLLKPDAAGRLLLEIQANVSGDLLSRIEKLGGQVVTSSADRGTVRARLPSSQIETLAAEAAVTSVRPAVPAFNRRAKVPYPGAKLNQPTREQRQQTVREALRALSQARPTAAAIADDAHVNVGAAQSEGDHAHGADRARKFFGVDGTGVRVGVLSDSDDFKEQSIASGDLPPDCSTVSSATAPCSFTVPGQDGRDAFSAGEGTAMMEIVHDLAPGARLYFATAFTSEDSFAANIRTLRAPPYNCDVIIDDVIYFDESPYQDDVIAQAVDDVIRSGANYFSSAGNEGAFDNGTSGTWEGDFKSAGKLVTLGSGYQVHDFGNGVISDLTTGFGGPLVLQWSDPGTTDDFRSSNDYDLFILDPQLREVLAFSTDIQDGHGQPFEWIPLNIPPGFRVVVAKHQSAATRAMHLILFGGTMGLTTSGASYGHATVADAFGVAAVDVAVAVGGEFTGGPTTQMELFSSDGYRRVFYDRNGKRIDEGVTFASGGGELRKKPDLTAADGVMTTVPFFFQPFFGTSAAAPHAGAIAALIKSALPRISQDKMRRSLLNGSLDIMQAGSDRNSGAGVVSAFNSLNAAGAPTAVFLELGSVTTTGSAGGFVVPGGTGQITVSLVNNGGAAAGTVRGTLSSATPGVTMTSATSSYGNIAPGATATNATPFTFSLNAAAACGYRVSFQLSVSFTGRGKNPTVLAFDVLTGKPGTTPVVAGVTGGPFAIPDADSAGVDVPITVAGVGNLSHVSFRIGGTDCSATRTQATVGIDHTFVGDLVARLTSPGGTTVALFSRAGGALNSGNDFCQTVLDDSGATSIQDITSSGAPWTGTFRPQSPLSVLSGENGNGDWVLNVADLAFIDTGSVRDVSVAATGFDCTH